MLKNKTLNKSVEILTLDEKGITDFASARNKLLKKSKSEWVFFVDKDEIVSDSLKDEIVEWLNGQMVGKYEGSYVRRKNYFLGEYIGTDNIVRLGKKDSGEWVRRVHETWKIKGSVGHMQSFLIHNTARSLNEYIAKINNYAKLHALANKSEGKKSNVFKIILFPMLKFGQSISNGRGVVFSILQAFHSFLAWSNLWLQTHKTEIEKYD